MAAPRKLPDKPLFQIHSRVRVPEGICYSLQGRVVYMEWQPPTHGAMADKLVGVDVTGWVYGLWLRGDDMVYVSEACLKNWQRPPQAQATDGPNPCPLKT